LIQYTKILKRNQSSPKGTAVEAVHNSWNHRP